MTTGLLEPQVGTPAPDFTLSDQHGATVNLSTATLQKNMILFFVRTPTCWQCREHVEQLARLYRDFQTYNTDVLVIVNASQAETRQYAAKLNLPFPILADPEHKVYDQYGLNKIMFLNTRTGSVVVDQLGRISYMKSAVNPGHWIKETSALLDHIKTLK